MTEHKKTASLTCMHCTLVRTQEMPLQTAFKRADAALGNLCRKAIEGVDGAIEYPAPAILRPYFREIELVVLARP